MFSSSLKEIAFSFVLNQKEYDCTNDFLLTMNQAGIRLVHNQYIIVFTQSHSFQFKIKLESGSSSVHARSRYSRGEGVGVWGFKYSWGIASGFETASGFQVGIFVHGLRPRR